MLGDEVVSTSMEGSGAGQQGCIDVTGKPVAPGENYVPGPDYCSVCLCENGSGRLCRAVLCQPKPVSFYHELLLVRVVLTFMCCEIWLTATMLVMYVCLYKYVCSYTFPLDLGIRFCLGSKSYIQNGFDCLCFLTITYNHMPCYCYLGFVVCSDNSKIKEQRGIIVRRLWHCIIFVRIVRPIFINQTH